MFLRFQIGPRRFFSEDQRQQVENLFEAILPGTEDSPGARDAGAAEYLSALLALDDSTYYELERWRKLYMAALPALDAASAALYQGKSVASLSSDETTGLLRKLADGVLEGMPADIDQKRLFATLRGHCIEGCFVDPRWGGNRDHVMWDWLGCLAPPRDYVRRVPGVAQRVQP